MQKTILFSNGQTQEMTFEEVFEQFKPMVIKAMKTANNKFVFNAVEEEDFKQVMDIELWRAYEAYSIELGHCFTTYLFYKLQKGVRNATYSRYSQKNQNNGVVSMNAAMGDEDLTLEAMFAADDSTSENIEYQELLELIRDNVSEEEEDALKSLLDKKHFSVQDYADKYNITRQAANQRIVKLKKKLQTIVNKQYLEI